MTSWGFDIVLSTFQYNDIAGSLKQLTANSHSPHWRQISKDKNTTRSTTILTRFFDDCVKNLYIRNDDNNILEELTLEL